MVMAPTLMHDSAVSSCFLGCLAFLHRLSHHNLLPHIPSISLSTVNSSPCPRIAPQSLNSSSQPLRLPGDPCPCLGYGWLPQGLPDSQFNLGCCRSAVSLSALSFSSDSDSCPDMGIRPLLQFPHPPRAGPGLLSLLFFSLVPLSYQVSRGSTYSFRLLRYSCLLPAGVLHPLLCLKLYS